MSCRVRQSVWLYVKSIKCAKVCELSSTLGISYFLTFSFLIANCQLLKANAVSVLIADDIVYLKESSGLVLEQLRVAKVETFENLTPSEIINLFARYRDKIFPAIYPYFTMGTPPDKWLASKHATLIHVADPVKFDVSFAFVKRDRRAWVVLDTPIT